MELDQAKEIIRALADGRDPATGQPFPPDSPYQQADTVRALFVALDALDRKPRTRNREPGTSLRPVDPNKPKAGGAWSPEEEQQLRDAFTAHTPITEIAAAHGRTADAINSRLAKLGLIEDPAANRAGAGNHPNRPTSPIRPTPPAAPSTRPAPPAPRDLTQEEKDNLPF